MLNKQKDELYCGVDKDKILKSSPKVDPETFNMFVDYIVERYNVHLKKDVYKKESPYTEDPIISEYKFTNVRREHDRETLWLINNIVDQKDLSLEDKMLNCILFRLFNKHQTAELLNMPIEFDSYNPVDFIDVLEDKSSLFNSAFMTSGMKMGFAAYCPDEYVSIINMRPMFVIKHMINNGFVDDLLNSSNQKDCFDKFIKIDGISDFLAYQIFVDLTYIEEFPFSENEFVVLGPGARAGEDFIFSDKDGLTYEEALFWMRDNFDFLVRRYTNHNNITDEFIDLKFTDRTMNIMSLENCLCEISKYIKITRGQGRRRKYYPYEEN